MKNTIIAAAALFALGAGGAVAQNANMSYSLGANVSTSCGVVMSNGSSTVDFSELGDQSNGVSGVGGDLTYLCNAPNGFSRTITSTNNGYLVTAGGGANNQISYTMTHNSSVSALNFSGEQLTAARTDTTTGLASFLGQGVSADISFSANGVEAAAVAGENGTTVFAGTYSDTLTIAITAQ